MATEDNKDISRRFLEALWNEKNTAIIDELLADNYHDHTTPPGAFDEELHGPEALKQFFAAIPDHIDIQVTIEGQIAEDDKVATQMLWKYTLKRPETPQTVTVRAIATDRIDNGKIVENWNTLSTLYRLLDILSTPYPRSPVSDPEFPLNNLDEIHTFPVLAKKKNPCGSCGPGEVCGHFGWCVRIV